MLLQFRIEAVGCPVTAVNSTFFFELAAAHANLQAVVDARCVSNNQGRTIISLCFGNSLQSLVLVGAHSNLCNIYIAIAHSHHAKVLLLGLFAAGSKFSDCRSRSRFGGLTAGVGIYLGIEYHNIDILAGCQYMVQTAVADIISPAVTAEDPVAAFNEELLLVIQSSAFIAVVFVFFQYSSQRFGTLTGAFAVVDMLQPIGQRSLEILRQLAFQHSFYHIFYTLTGLFNAQEHT